MEEKHRFCVYCGQSIPDEIEICPHCGGAVGRFDRAAFERAKQREKTKKVLKNPKIIGIITVAILLVVLLIAVSVIQSKQCAADGCREEKSYISNYCLAHTCIDGDGCRSLVSSYPLGCRYCSKHKCAEWSCEYSNWYDGTYCSIHAGGGSGGYDSSKDISDWDLKISRAKLSNNSLYTIAEGTLTNNSDVTVRFVKIKGAFKNSSGTVIDTDWTYAVGSEGLAPGESAKWRMSVDRDYSISSCSVSLLEYDVGT